MEPPQGRRKKVIPKKNIYMCHNCEFKTKYSYNLEKHNQEEYVDQYL